MFELPEMLVLVRQMNATLTGKTIQAGSLGNSPHKFVWYNRSREEFADLTRGKTVGAARARGRWLFHDLEPGLRLVFGECGGKILYLPAGAKLPTKYHLHLAFSDGSFFSAATQMWGAMELYEQGAEQNRQYIRAMRPTPTDPEFTPEYFHNLVAGLARQEKRSAKGLLTQDQLIPGLGNAIAQDILFAARLHPRHPIDRLDDRQVEILYSAIVDTVAAVTAQGGRYDEFDLYGCPGGYIRRMDRNAAGQPCPVCRTLVQSMQYLGGSCYLCPTCQE